MPKKGLHYQIKFDYKKEVGLFSATIPALGGLTVQRGNVRRSRVRNQGRRFAVPGKYTPGQ